MTKRGAPAIAAQTNSDPAVHLVIARSGVSACGKIMARGMEHTDTVASATCRKCLEKFYTNRPPARVITPEPEPFEPTHLLDARFTDGSRTRIRVRMVDRGGHMRAAFTREEWDSKLRPEHVAWQQDCLSNTWRVGTDPVPLVKLRPLAEPAERRTAQFTTSVLVRCTPEQAERWKRAAEADPDAAGNGQDFMRRALDEAADFALREKP